MFAMIKQMTGEEWKDFKLQLSTAIPMQNCDLPKLQSRHIEDRSAEIIMNSSRMKEDYPDAEYEEEIDDDTFGSGLDMKEMKTDKASFKKKRSRGRRMSKPSPKNSMSAPQMKGLSGNMAPPSPQEISPGAMAESVIMADQMVGGGGMDEMNFNLQSQMENIDKLAEGADSLIQTPFSLDNIHSYYRKIFNFMQDSFDPNSMVPSTNKIHVNPFFVKGRSPHSSLGGFDYRYTIGTNKQLIDSINTPTQVGVSIKPLSIQLKYITVPLAKEKVFLKARFANEGDNPYPSGPAQIFMENSFLGNVQFPTLGKNQGTEISLGQERDIKVSRKEESHRSTKGLVGKNIVMDVTVTIDLVSYKNEAVEIEVRDRVPQSALEKEIKIKEEQLKPAPSKTTEEGIQIWQLKLKPKEKKSITIQYTVEYDEDMQLTMSERSHAYRPSEEK